MVSDTSFGWPVWPYRGDVVRDNSRGTADEVDEVCFERYVGGSGRC